MNVAGVGFTVVGAGRSGIAAANALAQRGADVVLVEARSPVPRADGLLAEVDFRDGTNTVRAGDIAVLSPGIAEVSPLRAEIAGVAARVIGEVELFYLLSDSREILAITGTDGKSTTTTMLGAILAAADVPAYVGGNLGNPLCEGLDEIGPAHTIVAEVSCFQLTTCETFRPRVAIVTNIAEDHLDYHGSFGAYQAAKRRIWQAMTAEDTLILNGDDPLIVGWTRPSAPTVQTFSLVSDDADAWFDGDALKLRVNGDAVTLMRRSELRLLGRHNVANALAAGLAAVAHGVDLPTIRRGLMGYAPLAHRLAPIAEVNGVQWVNDSKATNPNAASAAVAAIDGPLVLLAGGSSKDSDFAAFGALVRDRARAVVLFGETRHALAAAIGSDHPVAVVETLEAAVNAARRLAEPGDTVLLSPACASYDQFDSYAHRGTVFTELVQALAG